MPVNRGEVYFVNLSPTQGREQAGRRPVLVVSNDAVNQKPLVVTVLPGTRGTRVLIDYAWNVRVPAGEANLPEETVFMAFQNAALDAARFQQPAVGRLSAAQMAKVDQVLAWTLALTGGSQKMP